MKKGPLHFLGRKNQSLFDTNIKIPDRDNVELVLESSAIPESGTASVRARPTVKHHSSTSLETFQGFAVPTPKVPILPPINGPKINGLVSEDRLSNGSVISVPDLVEGELLVPPPPSVAPPPPPGTFIPPPDFMGDLNSLDLAALQPPPMPAPNLNSLAPSMAEEDLNLLKPPPMAPPKPPSSCSSGSASPIPISSPPPTIIPEPPKFAPPQIPSERQTKTHKTPPPKPIRLSSISTTDSPPQTPAPPPPVLTPTPSTFNPQNTAKLYNNPKTSLLGVYEDRDTRPKQMLVLEDSGSVKPAQVPVQMDGKAPKVATPTKPISKDVQDLKEKLQITQPPPSPVPEANKEVKTVPVSEPPEIEKPLPAPKQMSPQLPKVNTSLLNPEDKPEGSPSQGCKFSPLLDRKLRNLKGSDTNGPRDGPVASPLALLMAAKERDKQRASQSLSRENSGKKNEQPNTRIQPSSSSPNSFIVTPAPSSSSSLTSQDVPQESPKSASPVEPSQTIQTPQKSSSPALVRDQMPFTSPTKLVAQKQNVEEIRSNSQSTENEDSKGLSMPLLPPPPEFDDLDEIMDPPPSIPPPDPPMKKAPTPTAVPALPAHIPPPPPKPQPPAAPKLPPPPPVADVKPKLQVQPKPKVAPSQIPANLSPSQATLLSILQKKMLEMDHKMAPVKEAESSSDDWGSPLSDEDNKVPVAARSTPPSQNNPAVSKATLDMRELEGKMARKHQETSSLKVPSSNGLQSKHKYGMTFTIRPGTKQPITLVSKGDS